MNYDAGRLLPAQQTARQHDTVAVAAPARREALRLLEKFGGQAPTYLARTSVLAASVVAAAELARYEQALVHLQQTLSAAVRGSFDDYVRARGTAATCFALLCDERRRALTELHASELALLRGNAAAALGPMQLALDGATAAALFAQERGLRVVLAEA